METYTAAVRIGNVWGEWFATNRGTRKGDPISPNTFILVLERILDKIRDKEGGMKIGGTRINNLAFADDIDLIEEDAQRLAETTRALNEEGKRYGLNMNFKKTKTMVFGEKEPAGKLLIDGRHLENVEQFTYLGSNMTYDLDNMREVCTRLAKATAALKAMEKVWKSRSIKIETKKEGATDMCLQYPTIWM